MVVLLLFVFVLVITWFTTRWISKVQRGQMSGGDNLEIIETQKISNNKYLQIVRAGDKYLVIAIGKDEVSFLSEVSKDELIIKTEEESAPSFASVLEKIRNKDKKKEE